MQPYEKSLEQLFLFATVDSDGNPSVSGVTLKYLTEHKNKLQKPIDVLTFLHVIYNEFVVNENNDDLTEGAQKLADALKVVNKELKLHLDVDLTDL